jgi:hypothetical protein
VCRLPATAHGVCLLLCLRPRRRDLHDRLRGQRTGPGLLLRCRLLRSDIRPASLDADRRLAGENRALASRWRLAGRRQAVAPLPAERPRAGGWLRELCGHEPRRTWAASGRVLSVYSITNVLKCISTVKQAGITSTNAVRRCPRPAKWVPRNTMTGRGGCSCAWRQVGRAGYRECRGLCRLAGTVGRQPGRWGCLEADEKHVKCARHRR